jgi:hypothetical protein
MAKLTETSYPCGSMNSSTRNPIAAAVADPPDKPVPIDVSRKGPLLAALEAAGQRLREQPWPSSARGKGLGEFASYDRKRAARQLLDEVAKNASVSKKNQASIMRLGDGLASHLPETLEDVDGAIVLAWLERELPIQWNDDQLALPEADRAALTGLIETTLAQADRGATPQDVAHRLAQAIHARLPVSEKKKDDARMRHIEKHLVEVLVSWLWRSRGRERDVAAETMEGLGRVLRLRWVPLPRPERTYSPNESFLVGDVLVHAKFGKGTVLSGTDTSIEVSFLDGARRLGIARPS